MNFLSVTYPGELYIISLGKPIFDPRFVKFVFRTIGGIKFWDLVEESNALVQLLLRWNTYLFAFQFWYCEWTLCGKPVRERRKVLLIFALWRCFNRQWISGGGVGQKMLFRGSWHPIKHDTFWHVLTGYFFVLFLWAIAVSDFCSWEIHKNFSLPSFAIIFTVNNHKDNHFYKWYASNIIQYEISFFTEIHVKVFYNHKNHGLQKKLYRKNSFLLL